MVCRLVHDEELRFGSQHLSKCNSLDLAAGELLHLLVRIREIELCEELHDSSFIFPEILLVKPFSEFGTCRHDLLEQRFFRIEIIFLLKECNTYVLEEHDLSAGVGLVLSCKNPHQGGLAGSVRRYEGNLVALVDVESDLLEENLRAV